MHRKCLLEERVCLLFLAVALSVTISFVRDVKAGAVQASDGSGQQLLEQGKPLVREVAEGEIHSYRVDLKAGEFLHVVIRQLGVNVTATLIAPNGSKLLEANIPRSTQETEWITHVAMLTGKYSIEVRTVDIGASASVTKQSAIKGERWRQEGPLAIEQEREARSVISVLHTVYWAAKRW